MLPNVAVLLKFVKISLPTHFHQIHELGELMPYKIHELTCFTVFSDKTRCTFTSVKINSVYAGGTILTFIFEAIIDILVKINTDYTRQRGE